jgi:hypothetical protein
MRSNSASCLASCYCCIMYRKQAQAMLSVASIAVLGGVTLTAGGLAAVKAIASMSEQRTQQEQQTTTTSEVCTHVCA